MFFVLVSRADTSKEKLKTNETVLVSFRGREDVLARNNSLGMFFCVSIYGYVLARKNN
jgi:hypothetical protein